VRISRKAISTEQSDTVRGRLSRLSAAADQVWPVCGPTCPSGAERNCHSGCPDIPRALSDAPEEYPLEARIAPLVYELRRLDGFRACWSCEGHERFGGLWKLPQVWFYAESQIHVRVLADAIAVLGLKGALQAKWEVVVTHSDADNPDTTYALQPKYGEAPKPLGALQADVVTITNSLVAICRDQAKSLQAMIS